MLSKAKIILSTLCIMFILITVANAEAKKTANYFSLQDNPIKHELAQGSYPSVDVDNILIKSKINTEIEKVVSNFVEDLRQLHREGDDVTGFVNYDIKANTPNVLSMVINCSTMYKGAAHPTTYSYGLSFDSKGNLFILEQLLTADKSSGKNLYTDENLYKAVYVQASDRIYSDDIVPLNIKFPTEFYLDENFNLHVLFQQYEIGPYAAGLIDINLK